jgi:hypothetical protein
MDDRCVHTCNTLEVMRSNYRSLHLSDHKRSLRDLLTYVATRRRPRIEDKDEDGEKKRRKSSGYLCKCLSDYFEIYSDDSHLSIVKCCYDILLRHYEIQLHDVRKDLKRKRDGDSSSTEEEKILLKRDQEVCVLLSCALMMATYGDLTERPIGLPADEDYPSQSSLSIQFNVLSSQTGTSIGLRGIGVGPLSQLFSQYSNELCSHQLYLLQSHALIECCLRHRQHQFSVNKERQS